jgi:hypothetical protein
LNVGANNHSASRITRLFPACEYYGLDLDKTYNNNPNDFAAMKDFMTQTLPGWITVACPTNISMASGWQT